MGSPWFNFGALLEPSCPLFWHIFCKKYFPKTHQQSKAICVQCLCYVTDPGTLEIELLCTREHDFQKITRVAESLKKLLKVD